MVYRGFTEKSAALVEPTTAAGDPPATLMDASGKVKIMFFDELARK
jgi:hypothetical protein